MLIGAGVVVLLGGTIAMVATYPGAMRNAEAYRTAPACPARQVTLNCRDIEDALVLATDVHRSSTQAIDLDGQRVEMPDGAHKWVKSQRYGDPLRVEWWHGKIVAVGYPAPTHETDDHPNQTVSDLRWALIIALGFDLWGSDAIRRRRTGPNIGFPRWWRATVPGAALAVTAAGLLIAHLAAGAYVAAAALTAMAFAAFAPRPVLYAITGSRDTADARTV